MSKRCKAGVPRAVYGRAPPSSLCRRAGSAMSAFDDLFDRVVVVNLDRRPDRMALVAAQLDALGVSYAASPRSTVGPVTQAWRPMRRSRLLRRRRRRSGATATSIWATAPRPRIIHGADAAGQGDRDRRGMGLLASMTAVEQALAEAGPP